MALPQHPARLQRIPRVRPLGLEGRGARGDPRGEVLKRVHAATNLPEAQLLVDLLGHRGVRARIFNANAASLAGELPIEASLPQVWVDQDAQAERARTLIDEYLTTRTTGTPVRCGACGEENPASFDLCWKCGRDLSR